METNRRGFIKGILALTALATTPGMKLFAAEPAPAKQPAQQPKKTKLPGLWYDRMLLVDSFFPMLEMNEKEVLHFYRDIKKKITVGYGTNVQANPSVLADTTIYRKGKKLTDDEKKTFLSTMTSKTDADLSGYQVSRVDAQKMAKTMMNQFVDKLTTTFTNPKTKKSFFFDLPLCMQALCLDVMYNVGSLGFAKFVKFKRAITDRDFATATRESLVYTNVEKRTFNKNRERLKRRLIRVMKIVQDNPKKPFSQIYASLQDDYKTQVPLRIRVIRGTKECRSEARLAEGELTHIRLYQLRAQANTNQAAPTPVQTAAKAPQKEMTPPLKRPSSNRSI